MNRCRHCDGPAWALVHLPGGCIVFPNDRVQWLCLQHYYRLDNTHDVLEWAS